MASVTYNFTGESEGDAPADMTLFWAEGFVIDEDTGWFTTDPALRSNIGDGQTDGAKFDLVPMSNSVDMDFLLQSEIGDGNTGHCPAILLMGNSDWTEHYRVWWADRNTYDNKLRIDQVNPGSGTNISWKSANITSSTDAKWRVTASVSDGDTDIKVYSWNGSDWQEVSFSEDNPISSHHTSDYVGVGVIVPDSTRIGGTQFDEFNITYTESDTISITSPVDYEMVQRNPSTNKASIDVSGTYSGSPATIEASWNGGAWVTLDDTPAAGSFSGTLSDLSPGVTLSVRFSNDTSVSDSCSVRVGDVFLIAGQSQIEGYATDNQTYDNLIGSSMWREGDTAWSLLADPVDVDGDGSIFPLLANYIEQEQSIPVGFISAAESGTGLVGTPDWNPDEDSGTDSYQNCITTYTNTGISSIRGILWDQGAADARDGVSTENYYAGLQGLAEDFTNDITFVDGTTRIVEGLTMFRPETADSDIDAIRAAQMQSWDNLSEWFEGPIMCDMDNTVDPHFRSDADIKKFADRFYVALRKVFYDGSDHAPVVDSITWWEDEIIVTFDQNLKTGYSFDTDPWEVTDDTGVVSVNSIAYHTSNAKAIILAMDGNLTGNVEVTFASHMDAAGKVVPRGEDVTIPGDTLNLPARPIQDYAATQQDPSQAEEQTDGEIEEILTISKTTEANAHGTRFSANISSSTDQVEWNIVDNQSGDAFTIITTDNGATIDSANILYSGLDYLEMWLPPFHTYNVRIRQRTMSGWSEWGGFGTFESTGVKNSYETYIALNANTITIAGGEIVE